MRPVAQIAQSVEQRIENPRVRGSIPRLGTMITKASQKCEAFLLCASSENLTSSGHRTENPRSAGPFRIWYPADTNAS